MTKAELKHMVNSGSIGKYTPMGSKGMAVLRSRTAKIGPIVSCTSLEDISPLLKEAVRLSPLRWTDKLSKSDIEFLRSQFLA